MSIFIESLWQWYERHRRLQTIIVAILFVWQLSHLVWLTTNVVFPRLFGYSLLPVTPSFQLLLAIADYAEIPALISATMLYLGSLRQQFTWKNILFIVLINSQWLHLFWITDEFIVHQFTGAAINFTSWLAWLAILIDYLEIPVIIDTVMMAFKSLRKPVRSVLA